MTGQRKTQLKHSLIDLLCVKQPIPRYAEHGTDAQRTLLLLHRTSRSRSTRMQNGSFIGAYPTRAYTANTWSPLLPVSNLLQSEEAKQQAHDVVGYSNLLPIIHPGGRGRTAIVRRSSSLNSLYVFKGVDFGAFLESRTDYEHRKNVCYHKI